MTFNGEDIDYMSSIKTAEGDSIKLLFDIKKNIELNSTVRTIKEIFLNTKSVMIANHFLVTIHLNVYCYFLMPRYA